MANFFLLVLLILSSLLNAREVKTVFSHSTSPYVFKDGSGIVINIVEEALAYSATTVKPVFINVGRSLEMFKYGYVDAISMIKKNSGLGAYYSEYFIQYHYAAFSLKSNQFNIKKISDLKNYYCISSQNATKYLGKEFSIIAKESGKKYSEVANQKEQVYKLLRGRTNVIIMDKYIFKFYQNELISEGKINKGIEVEVSELFKPTKYRIAFKDKSIRDDFNKGIEKLKNSGRYDKIYESYINKYFELRI